METPNYLKLINDAGDLISKIVLKVYDTLSEAGMPVNPGKIIQDINDNAFPVIKGTTYFKAELPEELIGVPSDKEQSELFEEQGIELLPKQGDHFGEEQAADLKKEFGTEGDNNDTGTPYQSREDVPESARELWDIMHGLRDDPHDDRWED